MFSLLKNVHFEVNKVKDCQVFPENGFSLKNVSQVLLTFSVFSKFSSLSSYISKRIVSAKWG
jgi:hypothetical protein